jgi:hypothetical protein
LASFLALAKVACTKAQIAALAKRVKAEYPKLDVLASHQRQQNIDTLNQALSSSEVQNALEAAHVNPQQVKRAVSGLSDEELAQLASRANKAQNDFAAGTISNHDLLLILVGITALILIIVAVH